jgi:hypothetical protein
MKRRGKWGMLLVLVVLFAGLFVRVYPLRAEHCDFTGSTKEWVELPFGVRMFEKYHKSELEEFGEMNFPEALKHRWISYRGTEKNVYGMDLLYSHGRPNALYTLRGLFLKSFMEVGSKEDVLGFYQLLRTGSDEDVRARVMALIDQYNVGYGG